LLLVTLIQIRIQHKISLSTVIVSVKSISYQFVSFFLSFCFFFFLGSIFFLVARRDTTFVCSSYRLIKATPIFETESRPRDCLPKNFPSDIPGTCHFLNGYRHPEYQPEKDVAGGESLLRRNIRFAVKKLKIGCPNA
jgi:hypothetical protein